MIVCQTNSGSRDTLTAKTPRGHGITVIGLCRLLYILTLTSIGPLSLMWLVGYLIEDGYIRRAYGMGHGVVVTAIAVALTVLERVEGRTRGCSGGRARAECGATR